MWFILIVINDFITIIGSSLKIQLETRHLQSTSENYDFCAIMLGTGNLLGWLGVLRYVGFFKNYNILILTLKRAFPNVIRFMICAVLMYFGFVFCGWVILGPYHIKFRKLSTTSECLFSLINGDDMYVTFSALQTRNSFIWMYSRVYLYSFIGLFIYVVLSLFIAVIMDSYETIKHYYEHGFPKSDLFAFIEECTDPPNSAIYRQELPGWDCSTVFCFCCQRNNPDNPDETTRLIGWTDYWKVYHGSNYMNMDPFSVFHLLQDKIWRKTFCIYWVQFLSRDNNFIKKLSYFPWNSLFQDKMQKKVSHYTWINTGDYERKFPPLILLIFLFHIIIIYFNILGLFNIVGGKCKNNYTS